MKKIGILTVCRGNNIGTHLQALAMQSIFSKNGCDAELINYKYNNNEIGSTLFPSGFIRGVVYFPYNLYKTVTQKKYRKKHFRTSGIYTKESISKIDEKYDAVVVGSDQVWNLDILTHDINFYMPWESKKAKKYSYAASLGTLDLSKWEEKYRISDYLSSLECVSVRESSAVKALEVIGISSREDLDPILYTDRSVWNTGSKKTVKHPYILLYQVASDTEACGGIIAYAQKNGLKVIRISPTLKTYKGVKTARFVSIEKWMELVKGCEMLITDSYHGISFAIANGCNFRLILLKNGTVNTRSVCLLEKLGLDSFTLQSENYDLKPDFDEVDFKLTALRERSGKYIESICE